MLNRKFYLLKIKYCNLKEVTLKLKKNYIKTKISITFVQSVNKDILSYIKAIVNLFTYEKSNLMKK